MFFSIVVLIPLQRDDFPDVTFQVWDFAGQKDFYVTHKVFLSPLGVYLLLYDLRTQMDGVLGLKPWLLDIQVRASTLWTQGHVTCISLPL